MTSPTPRAAPWPGERPDGTEGSGLSPLIGEAASQVAVFEGVTPERFSGEIQPRGRPALLKGAVADWGLVAEGRAGLRPALAALRTYGQTGGVTAFRAPASLGGRFFYAEDLRSPNFARVELSFPALLNALEAGLDDPEADDLYAGAVTLKGPFADLAAACPAPFLPADAERLTSLWIGGRSRTAAHWDLPQNLACLIAGRRRFTLFPIDQVTNLYIGPLDATLAGQPISLIDFANPDLEAFPRFADAVAHAEIAELEPGDALYLPSLWVHHVESRDRFGVMVNFWWRDGPAHLITPTLTLFHALLTLREMPADERLRWRALFDAFIFQPGGDGLGHLPEAARGLFGAMTPEKRARLIAMLSQSLR